MAIPRDDENTETENQKQGQDQDQDQGQEREEEQDQGGRLVGAKHPDPEGMKGDELIEDDLDDDEDDEEDDEVVADAVDIDDGKSVSS